MNDNKKGFWHKLWKPRSKWLLGIPIGGFVAFIIGILFLGGAYTGVMSSNTMDFCLSCHEMKTFVYPEYQQSSHYSNASGVRATCADCHVPKPWIPKMQRKIGATFKEVPGHMKGVIDTREKFEAMRWEMANWVWDFMRETDSRECRSCHKRDAMALDLQDRRARRMHSQEYFEETGKTCIDCHTGIAHKEPQPPLPDLSDLNAAAGGEAEDD